MSILQPREDRFYQLFEASAANVRRGAEMLLAMLRDYTDVTQKAKAIKDVEHEGDELTHQAYDLVNRIFVTPIDREDIAAISSALDDVLDLVEASADDFVICGIEEPTQPALELTEVIVQAVTKVQEAVSLLRSRKDRAILRERLTEINTLENEGDVIYRNSMQALFRQLDPMYLIKWKKIYDHLEDAIDSCEDVADVLHGVMLKYA
jgi:uncharacterized protein Yka (UPF0111/DUF47 family)